MPNYGGDKLICLIGPTASGKSTIAIEIAKQLPIEIVSVDSVLIYKGMDIGTAKPTPQMRARIPHHLIDIVAPHEYYSAARFRKDALDAIEQIRLRKHIPLLVGGTMFYFYVLKYGLSPMPESSRHSREQLLRKYRTTENLYRALQNIDPQAAAGIHPNDKQRVLRALSVCLEGEQTMSDYRATTPRPNLNAKVHYIALEFGDRTDLHRRIEQRLDGMLKRGLLDEVAGLMLNGELDADTPSMRAIAYRQVRQYLLGCYSYAEMVRRTSAASRQFAKRQLTWMRRMTMTARYMVDMASSEQIAEQIIENHLS